MKSWLNQLLIIAILSFTIAFIGCEKKTETPQEKPETTVESEPPVIEPEPVEEIIPEVVIPELKGKWSGKFDSRSTVLNITNQTDSSFAGKITISYREVINQDVEGTISPSTMKMKMKDLLHSRYRGKYSGTLSEDGNTYSGTFTMDHDGTKFSFSLKRN